MRGHAHGREAVPTRVTYAIKRLVNVVNWHYLCGHIRETNHIIVMYAKKGLD